MTQEMTSIEAVQVGNEYGWVISFPIAPYCAPVRSSKTYPSAAAAIEEAKRHISRVAAKIEKKEKEGTNC